MQRRNEQIYKILSGQNQISSTARICDEYYESLAGRNLIKATKTTLVPDRILDAPALLDDFYTNTLDWGVRGHVAVALASSVYLWIGDCSDSDASGHVETLLQQEDNQLVTAVAFLHDGMRLGVGIGTELCIYDIQNGSRVRRMPVFGESGRVNSLSFHKHLVAVGGRTGVRVHDVRLPFPSSLVYTQNIDACGVKYSFEGELLAIGTNDNQVIVVDPRNNCQPLHSWSHDAAVKALAWSPFQTGVLAAGGGSECRRIDVCNVRVKERVVSCDAGSQVSGIYWDRRNRHSIVSVHGFADNAIKRWRINPQEGRMQLDCVVEKAHDQRILHAAVSPCGEKLCTAGADECLKFWSVFDSADRLSSASNSGDRTVLLPKLLPSFAKNKQRASSMFGAGKKTVGSFLAKKK